MLPHLHLETIFQTLLHDQFYLKSSKCMFSQHQLEYLGHFVSCKGVEPEPPKVQAMVQWPNPKTPKDLCAFLGLTDFYRKFIKGYAAIANPLTSLLCKDAFTWTSATQTAFHNLKEAMTRAPILALPDFSLPFMVETDTSGMAIGVVLFKQGHPLAFFSKPFGPRMLHSSTYVKKLHTIVTTVRKWQHYLLGHPFTILTYHKSLKDLMYQ